jgi:GDPmannose 4,6-dehydratase
VSQKRALIFGISGQDGAYLADFLLRKGYAVHGTSRDAATARFHGLHRLGIAEQVELHSTSLTDYPSIIQTLSGVRPDEIYNLSAQSSVGASFEQPIDTFNSIANATLNLLEAIRFLGRDARFYNASSSEMFGDTASRPADETTFFRPRSPYGVAKAAAHWLIQNYRVAYGLYACSGILFNHESPIRHERFVTQKVVRAAVAISRGARKRLRLGKISIVRDWGWAPEYVEAMWLMLQQDQPEDYVIATGVPATLEEFAKAAFERVDLDWREHVDHDETLMRPFDVDCTVGNASKAEAQLGWKARSHMPQIAALLIDAELERCGQGRIEVEAELQKGSNV